MPNFGQNGGHWRRKNDSASGAITPRLPTSAILALILWGTISQTSAQQLWTSDDVRQAAVSARHSREIMCIFMVEIGGSGFNPYTPHADSRIVGPGGLSSVGLMPQFRTRGYDDPINPYQVAAYIDSVLDDGGGGNWPYLKSWIDTGRC